MTGVAVADTAITMVNPPTAPCDPPPSEIRMASGVVITAVPREIPDATTPSFTTETEAAGKYTLAVSAPGETTQTEDNTLPPDDTDRTFTF